MLLQSERVVRDSIRKSDVPFLGLLAETFTSELKASIEHTVLIDSSVDAYIYYLARYPALFSINIASHVMGGLGQTGHFELYTHIQQAICVKRELASVEKERLWKAFRKSILILGFEPSPRISGTHYMADEYLRQAGVPLAFVDALAERMLTFAKRVGLPDEDDQEALTQWQVALDAKLEQPFSRTARKAILLDTGGYYTRVFLKVHSVGGQLGSKPNVLEKAMARAFLRQGETRNLKRAALPYLSLHHGILGVSVPGATTENSKFMLIG
jgi:hypothetical protein